MFGFTTTILKCKHFDLELKIREISNIWKYTSNSTLCFHKLCVLYSSVSNLTNGLGNGERDKSTDRRERKGGRERKKNRGEGKEGRSDVLTGIGGRGSTCKWPCYLYERSATPHMTYRKSLKVNPTNQLKDFLTHQQQNVNVINIDLVYQFRKKNRRKKIIFSPNRFD